MRVARKLAWCFHGDINKASATVVGHVCVFGVSTHQPQCEEFSVIRKLASLALCGGQKNYMRHVRQNMARLVRPKSAAGSGFVLWRHAGISGVRDSSGTLSKLRQSEARATGVFG